MTMSPPPVPANLQQQPIIDAHHHLWDLQQLHYPFLSDQIAADFFLGDYAAIRRNYLPEDYRRDAAGHHVVKTVHVEAECSRKMQVEETEWLTAISETSGMPNAIVAHAWIDEAGSDKMLERQASFPLVKGIRTKPATAATPSDSVAGQPRTMQHPDWLAGIKLLKRHGLSWDLRVPTWHLEEAAVVARDNPSLAIVLNHGGFPWDRSPEGLAMWRKGMRALVAEDNVHVKISCLCLPEGDWLYQQNRPIIREIIDLFGPRRAMFASNFPVDRLRTDFNMIFSSFKAAVADYSRDEQQRLFYGTAEEFYRMA